MNTTPDDVVILSLQSECGLEICSPIEMSTFISGRVDSARNTVIKKRQLLRSPVEDD